MSCLQSLHRLHAGVMFAGVMFAGVMFAGLLALHDAMHCNVRSNACCKVACIFVQYVWKSACVSIAPCCLDCTACLNATWHAHTHSKCRAFCLFGEQVIFIQVITERRADASASSFSLRGVRCVVWCVVWVLCVILSLNVFSAYRPHGVDRTKPPGYPDLQQLGD